MQTQWDWTPYLVDGATRPDAMTNLDPAFASSLAVMFAAAPPDVQQNLRVMSAYRDIARQQQLWDEALAKYGDPEIADNWVAPPGRSNHNHGRAADLRYLDDMAREWAHANAQQFGLAFPLGNEPWHIEPAGARGGQQPAMPGGTPGLSFGSSMPSMPTDSTGLSTMFQSNPALYDFALGSPLGGQDEQTLTARAEDRRAEEQKRQDTQRLALASLIR